MDHKWGRNVLDYGLASTGATLAARILGSSPVQWMTNEVVSGVFFPVWNLDVNSPHLRMIRSLQNIGSHHHFPYGRNVEADGPV